MVANDDTPLLAPAMIDALRRSGYLMESRVNRVIREHKWFVNPNSHIPDPTTGTLRESDLIAEQAYPINAQRHHLFSNVAVIECINNDHPIVLLSRVPADPASVGQYFCLGGFPRTIHIPQGRGDEVQDAISLAPILGHERPHRFVELPAYDSYCTFAPVKDQQKKGVWRAEQPKDYYESFRKVMNVRNYFRELHDINLLQGITFSSGEPSMRIIHYHHVMVFNGPLLALDDPDALAVGDGSGAYKPLSHALLRLSVAGDAGLAGTLFDVITEDYVLQYLKLLDQEAQHFCEVLSSKTAALSARLKSDIRVAWTEYAPKMGSNQGRET